MNNFRGDLSDISAKKEALLVSSIAALCRTQSSYVASPARDAAKGGERRSDSTAARAAGAGGNAAVYVPASNHPDGSGDSEIEGLSGVL